MRFIATLYQCYDVIDHINYVLQTSHMGCFHIF